MVYVFPDGEVVRYIIYNGKPNIVEYGNKEVIYISPDMYRMDFTDHDLMREYVKSYKKSSKSSKSSKT